MPEITNVAELNQAIDDYVDTGFNFTDCVTDFHCYPRPDSTEACRKHVTKLLNDIEVRGYRLISTSIEGDDNGSFTVSFYVHASREDLTVWFNDDGCWSLKTYNTEAKPIGFAIEEDDTQGDSLIELYEWIYQKHLCANIESNIKTLKGEKNERPLEV